MYSHGAQLLTRAHTHRVLACQLGHVRVLEEHFGGGEFDAGLKLLIFTERELMIVKTCDPARLNAPTKPCNRAGVSVVRDSGGGMTCTTCITLRRRTVR
jgi:hypothetical protein